jgi:two-component system sensor kinase
VIIHPREIKISRDLSISVFRIIQEALTNIIRHSGATEVDSTMESARNSLCFRISDNGKGIPRKNIHGSKSFWILGIRERVRFWNGNLHIEGAPAKGMTLLITLPLDTYTGRQYGNNERRQDQADIDTAKSLRDNNPS